MHYNYDIPGQQYSRFRQTELQIAKYIEAALGEARTIINIGAGTGSYESESRYIIAVEPSAMMRAGRLNKGLPPAINASAEALPFDDQSFDAATALLTIHHWPDISKGLNEVRRITRGRIIVMTYDPNALDVYWNASYFPEVIEVERRRYPSIQSISGWIGGDCEVREIPIPLHCNDGFQEAFYGRPEAFLSKEVRSGMSAWGFIPEDQQEIIVKRLSSALSSGEWDKKYGHLRTQPFFKGALRLIIGNP